MRAKRFVTTATLVALLSGSMVLAAGTEMTAKPQSGTRALAGQATAGASSTDIEAEANPVRRKIIRIRERRTYRKAPPLPVQDPQQSNLCVNDDFMSGLAGLFGFTELVLGCQERD